MINSVSKKQHKRPLEKNIEEFFVQQRNLFLQLLSSTMMQEIQEISLHINLSSCEKGKKKCMHKLS